MLLNASRSMQNPAAVFDLGPMAAWRRLVGRALGLGQLLAGRHRYDAFRLEDVHGVPLLVTPSVFNPKLLRTGAFFAAQLAAHISAHTRVLDMGTGSGICAVFAARIARQVVGVDINPAAVRCARGNVLMNGLDDRVELRQGDLFDPVRGERFDRVLFNPPFLRGRPRDDRDRAWRSEDVPERFAAQLAAHLSPGGYALVLLSSYGRAQDFLDQFTRQHLAVALVAQRRYVNERIALFRVMPMGDSPHV